MIASTDAGAIVGVLKKNACVTLWFRLLSHNIYLKAVLSVSISDRHQLQTSAQTSASDVALRHVCS